MGTLLFSVALVLLAAVFFAWLLTRLFLFPPDLSRYDEPATARATPRTEASPQIERVYDILRDFSERAGPMGSRGRLERVRALMDSLFDEEGTSPSPGDVRIEPVETDELRGEWVVHSRAEPGRRLLYVHGGAFFAGSPRSHRPLTVAMSRRARAAVFAVDYRLLPEHRRLDGILDCQAAYRYVLEHGPEGPTPLDRLFVAGDSAGGNLTLVLSAWARDHGLRAPDGVVAFSPSTDVTLSSPTFRDNLDSDVMLGPLFRFLQRIPRWILLLVGWLTTRISPRHPILSPLFGALHDLPPTLVQASEVEIVLGDAARYVNKARSEGSPVTLQTWPGQVHVWQHVSFRPETDEALDEVERFLENCTESDAPPFVEQSHAHS